MGGPFLELPILACVSVAAYPRLHLPCTYLLHRSICTTPSGSAPSDGDLARDVGSVHQHQGPVGVRHSRELRHRLDKGRHGADVGEHAQLDLVPLRRALRQRCLDAVDGGRAALDRK